MSKTVLPPQAQFIAGQLEDNLTVWRSRTPGTFHPGTRASCVEAQLLCGEMIAVFARLRDELVAEMAAYDDELHPVPVMRYSLTQDAPPGANPAVTSHSGCEPLPPEL